LIEAVVLGNLGSILGIIFGVLGGGILVGTITPLSTAIPLWTVFLGIGFCSMVSTVFGVYPASKAARMDDLIVALRYE
jgi:putative ABC transport system permease protein